MPADFSCFKTCFSAFSACSFHGNSNGDGSTTFGVILIDLRKNQYLLFIYARDFLLLSELQYLLSLGLSCPFKTFLKTTSASESLSGIKALVVVLSEASQGKSVTSIVSCCCLSLCCILGEYH